MRDVAGVVRNASDPRRVAAKLRLARAKEGEANRSRDYLHNKAREIVRDAGVIGLEALNLRGMTRSAKGAVAEPGKNVRAKAALTRRMLDAGFGRLKRTQT
jgi:putative transposase